MINYLKSCGILLAITGIVLTIIIIIGLTMYFAYTLLWVIGIFILIYIVKITLDAKQKL